MKPFSRFIGLVLGVCVLATALCACNSAAGVQTSGNTQTSSSTTASGVVTATGAYPLLDPGYTDRDQDASYDEATATKITLQNTTASVSGNGGSVQGSVITISSAGTYIVSGTLDNGQILINVPKTDKVQLVLDNASITCLSSAPIYIQQADKVFLTLAENSQNTVTDTENYQFAEGEDEPSAAIFAKDDLTINGTGALVVNASYNNGIQGKDDLTITGGNITVTAPNNAIKGKDSVAIMDGTFTLTADGDGIQASNAEDTSKGWVSIQGGTFTITAQNDGIQAETNLQITGGSFAITTGGGSQNASTTTSGEQNTGWGNWGRMNMGQNPQTTENADDTPSAKGLKATTAIAVTAGTFTIDSSDDSIHSNGNVTLQGGSYTLLSGDDGIHADAALVVEDGAIDIQKSYEGLEGLSVTINGGNISAVSTDDCINSAGGDGSSINGRPGQNSFAQNGDVFIRITGGTLVLDAGGDSLDSNAGLYVDGGLILISGTTNTGDSTLDFDGESVITGGVVLAAGPSQMAQNFGSTSTQVSVGIYYSSTQQAGTLATLVDAQGNVVAAFAPSKQYTHLIISSPDLQQGQTYSLYTGGQIELDENNYASQGTLSGGTKLCDITISSASMSVSDSGEETTGLGGFGGQMGGGRGQMGGGMAPGGDGQMAAPPDNTGNTTPPQMPDETTQPEQNAAAGQQTAQ